VLLFLPRTVRFHCEPGKTSSKQTTVQMRFIFIVLLRNSQKEEKSQRVTHSCVLFEPVEKVLCVADGELKVLTSGYLVRTTG
jgi:hypothetical protein